MKTFIAICLVILGSLTIMGNGAIRYQPYPSRAINLTGAYALLLAESDNLIGVNPGAETGDMTGWEDSAPFAVTAGAPYAGTYKFEADNASLTTAATNRFSLTKNVRYKVIFAAKSASGNKYFSAQILDENGLTVIDKQFTQVVGTSWKVLVHNFTADRNYDNCNLVLSVYNGSGVAYYDYIYIVPEYCDYGTEDFAIDLLFQPFTDTGVKYLAHKYNAVLTQGWALTYSWTDYKYRFTIADGTTAVTVSSSAVTAIQNQEYHHLRVTVDRGGLVSFFVNNVAAGTGSIAAVTGNISVADPPLYIGGFDGTTDLAKGFLDFIRLSRGTLLTTAERALEYARIAAGRIRTAISENLLWDFNDGLLDSTGALRLASSPATTEAYADGWPYCVGPLTYAFTQNYSYGHRENYLGMDAVLRDKQTGRAFLYPGPRKREFILPFTALKQAQMSAFWAAWEGGQPLDFWPDAAKREYYTCAMTTPPEYTSTPYFSGGEVVYDTELELVET